MTDIKLKKLNDLAELPQKSTDGSAAYDLYACADCVINPGVTALIPCGFAMALPKGYAGMIYARSGLATKEGLRPANCVGVVDSDYRGEVKVALHNDSKETRNVKIGTRIAQLVIHRLPDTKFTEVETLDETERGAGGFGSTGK